MDNNFKMYFLFPIAGIAMSDNFSYPSGDLK